MIFHLVPRYYFTVFRKNFNGIDMFKELKKEDCQKKLWNGVHQEEENEVDLNLPRRKG